MTQAATELMAPAQLLERSPFFSTLPAETLQALASRLQPMRIPAGTAIVREGEEGDLYYLIASGEVEVWAARGRGDGGTGRRGDAGTHGREERVSGLSTEDSSLITHRSDREQWTPDPKRHTLLARLGPGDGFGEMALLLGGPRRATVRAASDLVLYSLDGKSFTEVVNRHRRLALALEEEMILRSVAASLGKTSPFAKMPPETLRWLATRIQPARFEAGQDIVRQGEPGDTFYVVRTGRVAVLVKRTDGTQQQVATLGPGDPFGEQALLTDEPRSATVRATELVEALCLRREDFESVLRQHQERQNYFVQLVLQRQRPQRIQHWTLERQEGHDGEVYHILKDIQKKRYVKLSEQAAFLWELMDGERTVRDLTLAYFNRYQVLGLNAVVEAMMQLHAAGFVRIQRIESEWMGLTARQNALEKLWLRLMPWVIRYFSLPEVDRALNRLYEFLLRPLYSRPAQALLLAATLAGTTLFAFYLARGELELPSAISLRNLALSLVLSIVLHGFLHEVAHAATCKHFRREVHGAGVGWYFFLPVAFADTSDIWMAGKWPRAAVALSGPYANFLLSALATLLIPWGAEPGLAIHLFEFAAIGYALGLNNLNPLQEFDGYYALADWLEVPNLRAKALAFVGSLLLRLGRTTRDPRLARIYSTYAALTLLYTFLIALLLLVGYEGYVEEFVRQFVPPGTATPLGWVGAGLVAGAILQRAWVEVVDSTRHARAGKLRA